MNGESIVRSKLSALLITMREYQNHNYVAICVRLHSHFCYLTAALPGRQIVAVAALFMISAFQCHTCRPGRKGQPHSVQGKCEEDSD